MKYQEIGLDGLYISVYIDDTGKLINCQLKKKSEEGSYLPIKLQIDGLRVYSEEVIE